MSTPRAPEVTRLLLAWRDGDRGALEQLLPLVYAELRRLAHRQMRRERAANTLQTTSLIHEAYLRLLDSTRVQWQDRAHFFAICAQLMRRVLVDAARAREAQKRGGEYVRIALEDAPPLSSLPDPNVLALDDALTRLAGLDPRKSQVVELRYFGGLTVKETAEALNISPETTMRDWKMAKLWLLRELKRGAPEQPGSR